MGKVWREGLDLLAEGGERGLGNKVSRHLPTETQSKRSLCIPTLSWASMRVVGRKLEEDALLFGEGFWAQGLRVVNWGKSSSFYPRVLQGPVLDSPSWQTGEVSAELSTRTASTFSPAELPATGLYPGTVHGLITHNLRMPTPGRSTGHA